MSAFPLPAGELAAHGIRVDRIERLVALIEQHLAQGRYPGCQIALARHGRLLLDRTFGLARTGAAERAADERTLWLLYSNTKVLIATALWRLAEDGALRFTDRVSEHLPAFARHGKRDVTVLQVITHQGGFPGAELSREAWQSVAKERGVVHPAMHASVAEFTLEWTPGSRVAYHPLAAHWVLAALLETLAGADFRDVVRDTVLAPLGLAGELVLGLAPADDERVSDMHEPAPDGGGIRPLADSNSSTWRRAGAPGGGGYGTARAMAALYQMMLAGGTLGGVRVLSPRTLDYAIRNHTGDRVDEYMGMPMHRGLGPHLRGTTASIRGLGAFAPPATFGHGGVGTSYCWADPTSGVSFAYLTNNRQPEPWHSDRLDVVSNLVHSAVLPA